MYTSVKIFKIRSLNNVRCKFEQCNSSAVVPGKQPIQALAMFTSKRQQQRLIAPGEGKEDYASNFMDIQQKAVSFV